MWRDIAVVRRGELEDDEDRDRADDEEEGVDEESSEDDESPQEGHQCVIE